MDMTIKVLLIYGFIALAYEFLKSIKIKKKESEE
jgi:hypothetical protein|tara:strand:+ start:59 stop:160 length:102 start_codon:yes stop_codon:yes gene_type:complete